MNVINAVSTAEVERTKMTNLKETAEGALETVGQKPKASKKARVAKQAPQRGTKNGKAGTKASSAKKAAKATKAAKTEPKTGMVRDGSKTAKVLELIQRPGGATLKELMKATGWQAHSIRGFISGTLGKKMGLTVTSAKDDDGERNYSIKG